MINQKDTIKEDSKKEFNLLQKAKRELKAILKRRQKPLYFSEQKGYDPHFCALVSGENNNPIWIKLLPSPFVLSGEGESSIFKSHVLFLLFTLIIIYLFKS